VIQDKVLQNIIELNLIQKKDFILIGVSGGIDSLALLHVLLGLKDKLSLKLCVIHVNHMLRGEEADLDQAFVLEYCRGNNLQVIIKKQDVCKIAKEQNLSIEEAAREVRYKIFHEVGKTFGDYKIAVAHHRNDQAETILMHIIRGTGVDGLKGMEFVSGKIIRPFLNISREEIEDYVRYHSLTPRVDSSNQETLYMRNRLRLELMPFIFDKFGVDITKNLLRLSEIVKDEDQFVQNLSHEVYEEVLKAQNPSEVILDFEKFANIHIAMKRRIVRRIIKFLKGNLKGIQKINIEKAIDFIDQGRVGTVIDLPAHIFLYKHYKEIRFLQEERKRSLLSQKNFLETRFENKSEILVDNLWIKKEIINIQTTAENICRRNSKELVQFFDYEKIQRGGCEILFRYRRNGDRIKLFENGRQKIKDYFINHKVDGYKRDQILLLACGNEILWIIGYAVTLNFAIDESTKTILKIEVLKK
jgi:tRNA(Ile)-lysidine synthase